jgi:hypothetical protein
MLLDSLMQESKQICNSTLQTFFAFLLEQNFHMTLLAEKPKAIFCNVPSHWGCLGRYVTVYLGDII